VNPSQQKKGKGIPTHRQREIKDGHHQDNQSKPKTKKDNGKTKKHIGKWCEFHKSPYHNIVEYRSKHSLVTEVEAFE
jgi:hypothetical protein